MAYYSLKLQAGVPFPQRAVGRVLLIDSIGDAPGIDVTLSVNDSRQKTIPGRRAGFKYIAEYTDVEFLSPVDCTLNVFLSMNEVDLGYIDGVQVSVQGDVGITNTVANPVPVNVLGATMTATNVGISNNLTTITNFAPATIGTAQSVLVADPTQKRLRIRNGHPTATIGIGASGVTLANAAVQIKPGDVWVEDDAPGATWYAISDTAGTNVQVQGLK